MWRRAWVNGLDQWDHGAPETYRLIQNRGTGLLIQGTQEWTDYRVSATITPHLIARAGIAARVGGMRRYYALLLCEGGTAQLVKALGGETVLAETKIGWSLYQPYDLALEVAGPRIAASVDGRILFEMEDGEAPLLHGAVALVVTEGRVGTDAVVVAPAASRSAREERDSGV